jgi:catechol 2,3-dioxygenase-like lactoylglutathione lyase family enzyme
MRDLELEHVNVTVVDVDRAVAFLTIAMPHWRVRGGGEEGAGRWVHLGTDWQYVSINQYAGTETQEHDGARFTGINHTGFWVSNVDEILAKMQAAGYEGSWGEISHRRKRLYVKDHDGITWEFIEYLSEKHEERNDYSI